MDNREKLKAYWVRKLQEAYDSDEYSEDQYGELKDEMTDYLDYDECEEVYSQLEL